MPRKRESPVENTRRGFFNDIGFRNSHTQKWLAIPSTLKLDEYPFTASPPDSCSEAQEDRVRRGSDVAERLDRSARQMPYSILLTDLPQSAWHITRHEVSAPSLHHIQYSSLTATRHHSAIRVRRSRVRLVRAATHRRLEISELVQTAAGSQQDRVTKRATSTPRSRKPSQVDVTFRRADDRYSRANAWLLGTSIIHDTGPDSGPTVNALSKFSVGAQGLCLRLIWRLGAPSPSVGPLGPSDPGFRDSRVRT